MSISIRTWIGFFLIISRLVLGQNLISNPGFENGMADWKGIWTRTPDSGLSEIVADPVHSGEKAAQLTHWGDEDWSFEPAARVTVAPNQVYSFSAWIQTNELGGSADLCITTFNAGGEAVDWSYQTQAVRKSSESFDSYSLRAVIPEGVATILPRFIGTGACDLVFDDVEMSLEDSLQSGGTVTLENEILKIEVDAGPFSMRISDKSLNSTHTLSARSQFLCSGIESEADGVVFHCRYIPDDFDVDIRMALDHRTLSVRLEADSLQPMFSPFAFPGGLLSGKDDFLIVPYASGMIIPAGQAYPFWTFPLWGYKATMSFAGVTDLEKGMLVISEDPWDSEFRFEKPFGKGFNSPVLYHHPVKDKFGYDRTFTLTFIESGGYVEMAQIYRQYAEDKGFVRTFEEKTKDNPNMSKLLGAVDFWALQSHFKQPVFIDSLLHFGVDRALVSLSGGWHQTENHAPAVKRINENGLLSSRYDIYTDVWPPTHPDKPWYRTEGYPMDVVRDADGGLHEGWLAYVDGDVPFQGYYTCSATHAGYARRWITDDLARFPYNCRFIDVELASSLLECYSTLHPLTRRGDAEHRTEMLAVVKDELGLVTGVEEARDWAFPYADYGEGTMTIVAATNAGYDWGAPLTDPGSNFINYSMNPARRIPLHGLVYHDTHVATWYTGDGLSKVPAFWDHKDLFNILYASMPLFLPPDRAYWQEHREDFLTSYHLVSSVFRRAGFAAMEDHAMLTDDWQVQHTRFANGWEVTVNFGKQSYSHAEGQLGEFGFFASDGTESVGRILRGGRPLAFSQLKDRLFINPYGILQELHGVRTEKSCLIRKSPGFLKLAFTGGQEFVDIHPDSLPWPMKFSRVVTEENRLAVETESLPDGWVRIEKKQGRLFYRLLGTFMRSSDRGAEPGAAPVLGIYPNPFRDVLNLSFTLAEEADVQISLVNIRGERVALLTDRRLEAGYQNIQCATSGYASGLYMLCMQVAGKETVRKATLIR